MKLYKVGLALLMYIIYIANRINSNIKERIIPIKHSNDLLGQLKKGYNLGEGGASQAKHNFDQAPMNLKIWPKPGFLFFLSLFFLPWLIKQPLPMF